MTTIDFATYLLYFASVIICVVKVGLLVRVRAALLDLPPGQRGLMTILADNNLGWCVTMVLAGTVIIVRVFGLGSPLSARFAILGVLVGTSVLGMVRLGQWFLYDDRGERLPLPGTLDEAEEIVRLRLLLERREREAARREGRGGIPDLGDERDD
jgi:hypothetical protein